MQSETEPLYDDLDVWQTIEPGNMWLMNKLQVAKHLNYVCGPAGIPVPKPSDYIVRPCINLLGMGRGAEIKWLTGDTESSVPAGYFWCEKFEGRHLSVDYVDGEPILAIEGLRDDSKPLWMWDTWRKLDLSEAPRFPRIFHQTSGYRRFINVEYIGDKVVEIHLRHNPDWKDLPEDVVGLRPVYDDVHAGNKNFIYSPEHHRVGFIMERN